MDHTPLLVSKKRLAELLGVTPGTVTKHINRGNLDQAVTGKGERSRIDLNHPQAKAYLEKRSITVPKNEKSDDGSETDSPKKKPKKEPVLDKELSDMPDDWRIALDMTLRQIIAQFGTWGTFEDILKAAKSLEDLHDKKLKNAKTEGDLVRRDLVQIGVIDPINEAHRKLLSDGVRTLSQRVYGLAQAGQSEKDIHREIQKAIQSFISPVKARIIKGILNA